MAHFADPEAHRCILLEISAHGEGTKHLAYLRAAVMGSMGGSRAAAALHEVPGLMERPTPSMRVQLALLSLTLHASNGSERYRQERESVMGTIHEVAAAAAAAAVHGGGGGGGGGGGHSDTASGDASPIRSVPGASFTSRPTTTTTVFSPGRSSTQPPAYSMTAAGSKTGSSSTICGGGNGHVGLSEEFLFFAVSYVNYMGGFTDLWCELFGPNYYVYDHKTGDVEAVPQVPPHLYAVNWHSVLTPERRGWCRGLHDTSKELLRRILCRAMPLETYVLYVLYAALSLRLRLVETAAELFMRSAAHVDVSGCVHQLHLSYRTQCEFARLQDLWHSFGLLDEAFFEGCDRFNEACSAAQGAFLESAPLPQQLHRATVATSFGRLERVAAHHSARSSAARDASGEAGGPLPSTGEAATADAAGASLPLGEDMSGARVQRGANAGGGGGADDDDDDGEEGHRSGGAVSGRSDFSGSGSPGEEEDDEDDTDSPGRGNARRRQEVYVPMFHTQCRFTWIMQRLFWSMYGRSTLLFSSCIHINLMPRLCSSHAIHNLPLSLRAADDDDAAGAEARGNAPTIATHAGRSSVHADSQSLSLIREGSSHTGRRRPGEGVPSTRSPSEYSSRASRPVPAPPSRLQSSWPKQRLQQLRETIARMTGGGGSHATSRESPPPPRSPASGAFSGLRQGEWVPPRSGVTSIYSSFNRCTAVGPSDTPPPTVPQPPFYLRYVWHPSSDGRAADELGLLVPYEAIDSDGDGGDPPLTEFEFLAVSGCYVLAHAIQLALTEQAYPATLLLLTDNSTRPGPRTWVDHKYVMCPVLDDPALRHGVDGWVLNFVLPRSRLSGDADECAQQERALVRMVVEHLPADAKERVSFSSAGSLFYILNGGPYLDGGRNYFVLHLHTGSQRHRRTPQRRTSSSSGSASGGVDTLDAMLRQETATAFSSLEELRLAWLMSCSCNEGLKLAAAIDP